MTQNLTAIHKKIDRLLSQLEQIGDGFTESPRQLALTKRLVDESIKAHRATRAEMRRLVDMSPARSDTSRAPGSRKARAQEYGWSPQLTAIHNNMDSLLEQIGEASQDPQDWRRQLALSKKLVAENRKANTVWLADMRRASEASTKSLASTARRPKNITR